jgi:hypothetical protein
VAGKRKKKGLVHHAKTGMGDEKLIEEFDNLNNVNLNSMNIFETINVVNSNHKVENKQESFHMVQEEG